MSKKAGESLAPSPKGFLQEVNAAAKENIKIALGYWKTILSVYLAGLSTAALGHSALITFLACIVAALIFHKFEKYPSGIVDTAFRICIALFWASTVVFTETGNMLVSAIK